MNKDIEDMYRDYLEDIKIGEIFVIGTTNKHPQLRTDYGFIDMIDLKQRQAIYFPWSLRILKSKEVTKETGIKNIKKRKEELLNKAI